MDLRSCLSHDDVIRAEKLVDYQPFILADDIQTGVAFSWWWRGGDARVEPPVIFRREDWQAEWDQIGDLNGRLRSMYEDLLDEAAKRFPGGSLLDVACNNGYFPIGAELRGMRGTGMDLRDFSSTFEFLNAALGTEATFLPHGYNSRTHHLPVDDRFDVCVLSAIICHLPDPLYFLAEIARVTEKALLFWGQIVDSDAMFVSYQPPHPNLSTLPDFPHCFNDNTRLSMGMFREAMRLSGFSNVIEIPPRPTWLEGLFHRPFPTLESELKGGSRHVVLLATR
jgi:SAM-dependent methyltransferase